MKVVTLILGAVLLLSLPVFAQEETPKADLFVGYEYLRFVPSLTGNPSVGFNGGGGAVNFNLNKMFGLKGEFTGATHGGTAQTYGPYTLGRSANLFSYLFGPQIAFRNNPKVVPYVHLLFGGSHSNFYSSLVISKSAPAVKDSTKEAYTMAFGGGLDVRAGKHMSIRLGQFDYFMTRFTGSGLDSAGTAIVTDISNQSNFRYMCGIIFHIGTK